MKALFLMIFAIVISAIFIVRKNYMQAKKNNENLTNLAPGAVGPVSLDEWDMDSSCQDDELLGEGIVDKGFPTHDEGLDLSGRLF